MYRKKKSAFFLGEEDEIDESVGTSRTEQWKASRNQSAGGRYKGVKKMHKVNVRRTSLHPSPCRTSLHPSLCRTSLHPSPCRTSLHPSPCRTSLHPLLCVSHLSARPICLYGPSVRMAHLSVWPICLYIPSVCMAHLSVCPISLYVCLYVCCLYIWLYVWLSPVELDGISIHRISQCRSLR